MERNSVRIYYRNFIEQFEQAENEEKYKKLLVPIWKFQFLHKKLLLELKWLASRKDFLCSLFKFIEIGLSTFRPNWKIFFFLEIGYYFTPMGIVLDWIHLYRILHYFTYATETETLKEPQLIAHLNMLHSTDTRTNVSLLINWLTFILFCFLLLVLLLRFGSAQLIEKT